MIKILKIMFNKIYRKKVILLTIIGLSAFLFLGFSNKKILLPNIENKTKDTVNKIACDTLILRQTCRYCKEDSSEFYYLKFTPNTTCICYWDSSSVYINSFLDLHKNEIKIIIIENPSWVLEKLKLNELNAVETFVMEGNDTDKLQQFPEIMLKLPNLKNIELQGVYMPEDYLKQINVNYPNITITIN